MNRYIQRVTNIFLHYKYTLPMLAVLGLGYSLVTEEYINQERIETNSDVVELNEEENHIAVHVQEFEESKVKKLCDKLELPFNETANEQLLSFINDWMGTSYCYGGSTKKCVDCSGFTNQIYNNVFELKIPRSSADIHSKSMPIKKHALYEGDLVFFATSGGSKVSHVGVYLWEGYFVHASTKRGVIISNLKQGYYGKTFVSGGPWLN